MSSQPSSHRPVAFIYVMPSERRTGKEGEWFILIGLVVRRPVVRSSAWEWLDRAEAVLALLCTQSL